MDPHAAQPVRYSVRAYEQLPLATRKEVRALAKVGQLHPNPLIAASSLEFARRRLRPRVVVPAALRFAAEVIFFIGSAVLLIGSVIFGSSDGLYPSGEAGRGGWYGRIADQRMARRVRRIAAHTTWQSVEIVVEQKDEIPVHDLIRRETDGPPSDNDSRDDDVFDWLA